MLGRIPGIGGTKLSNDNSLRAKLEKYRSAPSGNAKRASDSTMFSSDSIYLNNLPWKLKNYKYRKDEVIEINFELHDYIFTANIDLSRSRIPSRFELTVSDHDNVKYNFLTSFTVSLSPSSVTKSSFPTLEKVFDRITELKIYTEYKIIHDSLLKTLTDDFTESLKNEFSYISNIIQFFYSKLTNEKIAEIPPSDFECTLYYIRFSNI